MENKEGNNPRVSVLMPAYNAEKYIGEAIESILKQTFTDFEFIIVDDGSTDKTWEIIQEYAEKDSRIVPLQNEKNLGVSATRNKLVKLSKGKYIIWQDADDISIAERFKHQYDFMERNKDVGICGGYLEFIDNNKNVESVRKFDTNDDKLRKTIFRHSPVSQGASILRKSIVDKTSLFNEKLTHAEDLDLSFQIGQFAKFANLQEVVLQYRWDQDSVTFMSMKDSIRATLNVRKKAIKEYGYKMSLMDVAVYYITGVFIFLPARLTYMVFNFIRNN